jgi:hypothetical protein
MPQIEYASCGAAAMQAYRSLSRHSGLPVEEVARLANEGELRSLFGANGELLSQNEIRSRFGATKSPPVKAPAVPERKRPGIDGRRALDRMMSRRPIGDARAELLWLKAKRLSWTNP